VFRFLFHGGPTGQGREAFSLNRIGNRRIQQFQKCWHVILAGDQGITVPLYNLWSPDIERNPDGLVVPDVLSHQAMRTHTVPVIGRQHYDRVLCQAFPVQILHDPAKIIIQSFYGSVVLSELLPKCLIGSQLFRNVSTEYEFLSPVTVRILFRKQIIGRMGRIPGEKQAEWLFLIPAVQIIQHNVRLMLRRPFGALLLFRFVLPVMGRQMFIHRSVGIPVIKVMTPFSRRSEGIPVHRTGFRLLVKVHLTRVEMVFAHIGSLVAIFMEDIGNGYLLRL